MYKRLLADNHRSYENGIPCLKDGAVGCKDVCIGFDYRCTYQSNQCKHLEFACRSYTVQIDENVQDAPV